MSAYNSNGLGLDTSDLQNAVSAYNVKTTIEECKTLGVEFVEKVQFPTVFHFVGNRLFSKQGQEFFFTEGYGWKAPESLCCPIFEECLYRKPIE